MKSLIIPIACVVMLTACVAKKPPPPPPPPKPQLSSNTVTYSYIIGNVLDTNIDAEQAADVYATPASCQKVITTLLALKVLGSDYQYQTHSYRTPHEVPEVVLRFSGDPRLSSNDLTVLLEPFRNSHVSAVWLDASYFRTPDLSRNLMRADAGQSYGQPVSSMNIDKNLLAIIVQPKAAGTLAQVSNPEGYRVDNMIRTTNDPSSIQLSWQNGKILASGHVNAQDDTQEYTISPEELDTYARQKVLRVMQSLQITGEVWVTHNPRQLPGNLIRMQTVYSPTLREIIPPAHKISDNLVYDSLYLTLIHQETTQINDWADGSPVIKSLVQRYLGVNLDQARLVDGSGLSRYNRIQPRKMLQILRRGYRVPYFLRSLSKPGEANTGLAKRTILPHYVRAKTGNMSGITCVCGYALDQESPQAFVVMANNFGGANANIFPRIDTFLRQVFEEEY